MPKKKQTPAAKRDATNTTVAEVLDMIAPPREGTTGAHLVQVAMPDGPAYLIAIQGPEARVLALRVIDFVDALKTREEEKQLEDSGRTAS